MLYKHPLPTFSIIPPTLAAVPSAVFCNDGIGVIEGMSVDAMGLRSLLSHHGITVSSVSHTGRELQMTSATASLDFAEMVNLCPTRNNSMENETVGIDEIGMPCGGTVPRIEMSIPLRVKGANPKPTVSKFGVQGWNRTVLVNVSPEAFFRGCSGVDTWHSSPPASLYNNGDAYDN